MQNLVIGKVAGVFVTGSGFGGGGSGAELTMLSMLNNIAELGMIIIPLPKNTPGYSKGGLQWGPYGRTGDENLQPVGVSQDALGVARLHGANIARAATALKNQPVFGACQNIVKSYTMFTEGQPISPVCSVARARCIRLSMAPCFAPRIHGNLDW